MSGAGRNCKSIKGCVEQVIITRGDKIGRLQKRNFLIGYFPLRENDEAPSQQCIW